MKVYTICDINGQVRYNEVFSEQKEAENRIKHLMARYRSDYRSTGRGEMPLSAILFSVKELDLSNDPSEQQIVKMELALREQAKKASKKPISPTNELLTWALERVSALHPDDREVIDWHIKAAEECNLLPNILQSVYERRNKLNFDIFSAFESVCAELDVNVSL